MTESDRKKYMDEIAKYREYNANNKLEIPDVYDCADVATYLYGQAIAKTSTERSISDLTANGKELKNISDIHSSDFFLSETNNITYYADISFNNPNIEPGTIAVWKAKEGDTSWIGHIATIIEVKRDEKGDVESIITLEGHINKPTSIDDTNTSQAIWNSYKGDFLGFGEIGENSTTPYREVSKDTKENNIKNKALD